MNEHGLTARGLIDPGKLDRDNYAQSLAEEALRTGIMTEADFERIRGDLLTVLAQVIGYKTGGESTNVSTEEARVLSESLLYNIGTALRAEGDPDANWDRQDLFIRNAFNEKVDMNFQRMFLEYLRNCATDRRPR